MITLNQTIKKAEELRSNHPQLNSFYFGPVYEVGSSGAKRFPLFAMDVMPGSLSPGFVNERFILYFADILNQDRSNESEIFNDCKLVALDIYSQLYEYFSDNNIEIDPNAPVSYFRDKWDDYVAGVQVEINIPQFFTRDSCQVPVRGVTPWILAEGIWDDSGIWKDASVWIDN